VRVEVSGDNPTHDQPLGNDGVRLSGVHELDAYAFEDGKTHALVLFNYGLHIARRIGIEAPGLASHVKATLTRLKSSRPDATNENSDEVKVEVEPFSGAELTLPPCSMAVLEWPE